MQFKIGYYLTVEFRIGVGSANVCMCGLWGIVQLVAHEFFHLIANKDDDDDDDYNVNASSLHVVPLARK